MNNFKTKKTSIRWVLALKEEAQVILDHFKLKKVMFEKNFFFEEKTNSLISLSGEDKFSFLQGIISNDIETLKKKTSIYSAILSPQGKYFSDFFISLYNDNILIEINNDNSLSFSDYILEFLSKTNKVIEKIEKVSVLKKPEIVKENKSTKNFQGKKIKSKKKFYKKKFFKKKIK